MNAAVDLVEARDWGVWDTQRETWARIPLSQHEANVNVELMNRRFPDRYVARPLKK